MFKKKIIIVSFFLIISITISIAFLGRLVERKMSKYVQEEVNRVSKILIRDILDEKFLNSLDLDNLFKVVKDSNNEIEIIDFNTTKVNSILGNINNEVLYYFSEFDKGNIDVLYVSKIFKKYDDGVFISVPLGIIFQNPIIVSVGPNIPVKLLFSGDVESNIITSIKQYGINSVLLEISVEVKVREKIIFPFSSEYVDVYLEVPLVIELISGKVPENYIKSEKFGIME